MKRKIGLIFLVLALSVSVGGSGLFCGGIGNVRTAHAGGIPTIDIAGLMQKMISYLTQLMEYSEEISNTASNAQQYAQMIKDYQQKLREYQHYLNQLQSIRHMISNQDWAILMGTIRNYYGRSKRSVVYTMDPDSKTYESDLGTVLGQYDYVPPDPNNVRSDAQNLGLWTPQYQREVEEDYRAYNLYKDRMRIVSNNARKNEQFQKEIETHAQIIESLGDESDLATLQEMATANVTIMKQNKALSQTMNQILMNQEQEEAKKAAKRAKARNDELNRLKNRERVQTPGKNRWGKL